MARQPKGPNSRAGGRKPAASGPAKKASAPQPKRGNPRDTGLEKMTERLVNLAAERANLGADIADIYADAKDRGFDTKVLRRTVRILGETSEARSERLRVEEESDEQLHSLGFEDTPLGNAAAKAAEGRSPPPKVAPLKPEQVAASAPLEPHPSLQ